MKITVVISTFLMFTYFTVAQTDNKIPRSKHKADLELHIKSNSSDIIYNHENIVPLNTSIKNTPTVSVFGYLPYWKYPYALDYLQYDLLSHIAVFDFQVSQNGSIDYPPAWPWTDLINESHENGVKIIITAVNFSGSQIHTILTDPQVKENFFSNLLLVLQQYNLDGVNIDFEGIISSDRGSILNNFMYELTSFIHEANSAYEISFAGPPVNWGGWDFEGLATSCDYIFIMGYNFWGSWSNTSGPCAPLVGGSINITKVILEDYGVITENNPEKLILGVPYYGNKWTTQNQWPYSDIIDHISQPTFSIAMGQAEQDTIIWDNQSCTSWSYNSNSGQHKQIWFDTDSSLGMKYELAQDNMLQGVGMWALGYDGARSELWDELRKRFGKPIYIDDSKLSNNIISSLVFPNPFKNTTSLEITLENNSKISIFIYDSQGRVFSEVTNNQYIYKGKHRLNIDLSNGKPGIYFCKIICNINNTQSISRETILRL